MTNFTFAMILSALGVVLLALIVAAIRLDIADHRAAQAPAGDNTPTRLDVASAQAIQDPPEPVAAKPAAPDDDKAFLDALAADLTRSRAVRRLARRLETTR